MEVPDLSLSSVGSLDDHISVVNEVKISSTWECRYYVEISFNIETELLIQLTLLWFGVIVNVNDLPLLSKISSFVSNLDVSVLSISVEVLVLDFNHFSFFIDHETCLVSKELPPS
jgi:hypothetical protein